MKTNVLLKFYHQSHIWQNSGSWVMGQSAVSQSDGKIPENIIPRERKELLSLFLACR